MKYMKACDYEYIKNKYPSTRFSRNDEVFSHKSGMSPDDIISGIMENDAGYAKLSHPVRKARALEYVLKNTRIACDERDIFPAINMIDRPLSQTLIKTWNKEIFDETIPEIEKSADSWNRMEAL